MHKGQTTLFHLALLIILCTVPLLYGARHPLIHGFYSSALLLLCGSVYILQFDTNKSSLRRPSFVLLFPLILLLYIFFTSISLPMPLLEVLSAQRADSLQAAREIGGAVNQQTALAYYAPKARFYAIYGLALLFLFHTSVSFFQSRTFLQNFLLVVTVIGTFEAVYGLLQAMNPDLGVLWADNLPRKFDGISRGTIIYRNQYALFLNLCWPIAAAYGISLYRPLVAKYKFKRQRRQRMTLFRTLSHFSDKAALPIFCSALMILAILFSRSRGGILTLAISGLLFNILLPAPKKTRFCALAVIGTIVISYGMMIGGFDEIILRFQQFFGGAQGRMSRWLASLPLLHDHLFTGIGMGGYEWLSPLYLESLSGTVWHDRAHNEYFELIIELGLPVAIVLFSWVGLGFAHCSRIVAAIPKQHVSFEHFSTLDFAKIGAFCSLAAFLLHGFVDFTWRLPANLIYIVTLVALLTAPPPDVSPKKVRP